MDVLVVGVTEDGLQYARLDEVPNDVVLDGLELLRVEEDPLGLEPGPGPLPLLNGGDLMEDAVDDLLELVVVYVRFLLGSLPKGQVHDAAIAGLQVLAHFGLDDDVALPDLGVAEDVDEDGVAHWVDHVGVLVHRHAAAEGHVELGGLAVHLCEALHVTAQMGELLHRGIEPGHLPWHFIRTSCNRGDIDD